MIPLRELLLANLYLGLVWVFYDIFLRHSRSFGINRFYLLAGSVLALVLPWLPLHIPMPAWPAFLLRHSQSAGAVTSGIPVLQEVGKISGILTPRWISYAYLVVTGCAVLFSIVQMFRLALMVFTRPVHRWGRQRVVEVDRNWSAFSFFGIIFFPEPFDRESGTVQTILAHELVHTRQLHSLDNLFLLVLRILFFYNPAVHLLAARARLNHEFIADEATAGHNPAGYSETLICHQFLVPRLALMHTFNSKSLLNRRLAMLLTRDSNKRTGWRYLLAIPVMASMVLLSGWSTPAKDGKRLSKAPDKPKMEKVETLPLFQGKTLDDFGKWVASNVKYPQDAIEAHKTGAVFVSFTIKKTGEISDVKVIRSLYPSCDREAVRVVKSSPRWIPATSGGQPVDITFNMPVRFMLN